MKKNITIVLAIILLFNICGNSLLFQVFQYSIQREIRIKIKKTLKEEDLTLIIVSSNDESTIHWKDKNKEFWYKGEMYDVVKSTTIHQKKYYYCIRDIKEKQLIAKFNKNNTGRRDLAKRIKRVSTNILFFQQITSCNFILSLDIKYLRESLPLSTNYINILLPPPKIV